MNSVALKLLICKPNIIHNYLNEFIVQKITISNAQIKKIYIYLFIKLPADDEGLLMI